MAHIAVKMLGSVLLSLGFRTRSELLFRPNPSIFLSNLENNTRLLRVVKG